jgi:hypothetical protein
MLWLNVIKQNVIVLNVVPPYKESRSGLRFLQQEIAHVKGGL